MPSTLVVPDVPDICSIGLRPWVITSFLVGWMRYHFSAVARIEDSSLKTDLTRSRNRLWQAGNTNDGMIIEDVTSWKPQKTEARPAILVARHDVKIVREGIGDRLMGWPQRDTGSHFALGLQGSHTLFCLATHGPAAEILGMEVARELYQFGQIIRKELNLHRFVVVGVGQLFRVEEAKTHYAVPVTIAYIAEDYWSVFKQGPFLKSFKMAMTAV